MNLIHAEEYLEQVKVQIDVMKSTLTAIHFFYCDKRIRQVFLNCELEHWIERFVLAHEIGHVLMHPNQNTPFLQSTFFSVDKLEIEANKFAVELVIPDIELMEHWEYTVDDLAMFYGLPREIILLRLDSANISKEVNKYLV